MSDIFNINIQDLKREIIDKGKNVPNNYHNDINYPNLVASSLVFKESLDSKIIQLLIEEIQENQEKFELGKIGSDEDCKIQEYSLNKVRNSFVYFLPYTHWVYGIVWDYILKANREMWNYDITEIQSIQITKYGPGQFYNWHVDFNTDKNHPDYLRKLSMSIQLNDPIEYEGGVLELFDYYGKKITTEKRKGCVSVFESRTRHRVTKIKIGVRYSLVAWITGPQFK